MDAFSHAQATARAPRAAVYTHEHIELIRNQALEEAAATADSHVRVLADAISAGVLDPKAMRPVIREARAIAAGIRSLKAAR